MSGKALALSGGYIFTADSDMDVGLKGDMEKPTPITTYSGDDAAFECRLVGDSGFMTYYTDLNKRGVRRLDLSDPANPLPLGNWDLPSGHFLNELGASSDFVVLTFSRLHNPSGFVVFDASGGGLVHESTTYTVVSPDFPTLSGNHAFITEDQALRVYDLSVPSTPTEIAMVSLPVTGRPVLDGNLLYVPIEGGVRIVDVTNPASPVLRGATSVPHFDARDIALVGDRAYVAGEYGSVLLVDVAVAAAPVVLDQFPVDGTSIAVGDNVAFVARLNHDVIALDVSNPSAISIAGVVYPLDGAQSVAHGDGFIAVPSESGLQIYPPWCTATAVGDDTPRLPTHVSLRAYPNPFNPRTTVSFEIPARDHVRLAVYDVSGREVAVIAERVFPAGMHAVEWDGRGHDGGSMASGVYFARLVAGDLRAATKLNLLK